MTGVTRQEAETAVLGHPWPSTAGSAPADPPPQQHLRSACCEGPLRCACDRVAAGKLFKIKIKIKIKIKKDLGVSCR